MKRYLWITVKWEDYGNPVIHAVFCAVVRGLEPVAACCVGRAHVLVVVVNSDGAVGIAGSWYAEEAEWDDVKGYNNGTCLSLKEEENMWPNQYPKEVVDELE